MLLDSYVGANCIFACCHHQLWLSVVVVVCLFSYKILLRGCDHKIFLTFWTLFLWISSLTSKCNWVTKAHFTVRDSFLWNGYFMLGFGCKWDFEQVCLFAQMWDPITQREILREKLLLQVQFCAELFSHISVKDNFRVCWWNLNPGIFLPVIVAQQLKYWGTCLPFLHVWRIFSWWNGSQQNRCFHMVSCVYHEIY
jgi:hypothetical protein